MVVRYLRNFQSVPPDKLAPVCTIQVITVLLTRFPLLDFTAPCGKAFKLQNQFLT